MAALAIAGVFGGYRLHQFLSHERQLEEALKVRAMILQSDPIAGGDHRPRVSYPYACPECPQGGILIKTNNLGFREDSDTEFKKGKNTVRILVTGDSHTDGIVLNSASFPNLLEDSLNRQSQNNLKFEVINGGVALYGFMNYLDFLKKYQFLNPDFFIVTVYLGNDFLDTAYIKEERPTRQSYRKALEKGVGLNPGAIFQHFNQEYYFNQFPEKKEKLWGDDLNVLSQIQALCRKNHIELIVILLPSKPMVEWELDSKNMARIARTLGLQQAPLEQVEFFRKRLVQWLSEEAFTYLDLFPTMKNSSREPYFYKFDYHLNSRGHQFVAQEISKKFGEAFLTALDKK